MGELSRYKRVTREYMLCSDWACVISDSSSESIYTTGCLVAAEAYDKMFLFPPWSNKWVVVRVSLIDTSVLFEWSLGLCSGESM